MLMAAFLMVAQTAAALPPVVCDGPDAEPGPRYACLANRRARDACIPLRDDDQRPFTLCLAETYHDALDDELRVRLAAALRRVKMTSGAAGVARLRAEQRRWQRRRERRCADASPDAPVSQVARNQLDCLSDLAMGRIAFLSAIARER